MLILFLYLKGKKIKSRHQPQQFLFSDVYFPRSFLALSCRLIPFEENTKPTTMRTTAYKQQRKCMEVIKNELRLSVNVFSWKVLIDKLGNLLFLSPTRDKKTRHFTLASEPREGLAICRAKVVPSFLSYLKTLRIGPVPGIEPATSRSAVKRSTDWANPAAEVIKVLRVFYNSYDLWIIYGRRSLETRNDSCFSATGQFFINPHLIVKKFPSSKNGQKVRKQLLWGRQPCLINSFKICLSFGLNGAPWLKSF